ncbi:MAG: putative flap endonuclease-1-like 5' DNA nuclease [Patiriisocius sp.]|jgi:predicted flap endonuclease-1-like 5' DNA nuclease
MLLLKTISPCSGADLFWPFFWWLLAAFLIGLLMPRLLLMLSGADSDGDWKNKYDSLDGKYNVLHNSNAKLQKDYDGLKAKGGKSYGTDWKAKYVECMSSQSSNMAASSIAGSTLGFMSGANVDTGERDNLTKVEGIGPKIQELINEGGIFTYIHLSNADVAYLRKILDDAGPAYKVHQPGTWPDQSKMASEGRWDELKKWQDELKGGK